MRLNEVDKYFCKDTELQNYTKTGVKRIINPIIFHNNFHSCNFAFRGKTCIQEIYEVFPHVTVRSKITKCDMSVYFCFI